MSSSVSNQIAPEDAPTSYYYIRNLTDFEDVLMSQQKLIDLHLYLQISSEALTKNDFHELIRLLKNRPCYIFLDFSGAVLLEDDIRDIITLLSYSSAGVSVYGLDFSQTSIKTSLLISLIPVLDVSSILVLNLSYTMVSDRFFDELFEHIRDENMTLLLVSLSLKGCYRIGQSDSLCALIANAPHLQTLDLAGTALQLPVLLRLTDLLYEKESLTYLSIANLYCISLSSQQLDWKSSVKQLMYNIIQLPHVQSLDLSGTMLKDIGLYYFEQIAATLISAGHAPKLENINLAHTGITDNGVPFLKNLLSSMKVDNFKSINLTGNQFSVDSITELQTLSTTTSIPIILDPFSMYYGRGLFPRLLERDTQYMDKYSQFSSCAYSYQTTMQNITCFFTGYGDNITSMSCMNPGDSLKTYSQKRDTIASYLLQCFPSLDSGLPILSTSIQRLTPRRRDQKAATSNICSISQTQLFFSTAEIVYGRNYSPTETQALDSITYAFSSDDESSDNNSIEKRPVQIFKKPITKPSAVDSVLYFTVNRAGKSLSASTFTSNCDSLSLFSDLLQKENDTFSPFYATTLHPPLKENLPDDSHQKEAAPFSTSFNYSSTIQLNDAVGHLEPIKSVLTKISHDQIPVIVPAPANEMFIFSELETERQQHLEDLKAPESDLQANNPILLPHDLQDNSDLSSMIHSISSSNTSSISSSSSTRSIQTSVHKSWSSSATWNSDSQSKARPHSSSSSQKDSSLTKSDEWSSPCVKESENKSKALSSRQKELQHLESKDICTPTLSLGNLEISETRKLKLQKYMACTSDDPQTSKCGFINNLKIWVTSKQGENPSDIYVFLRALDKSLLKARDCRKLGDFVAFPAVANMHNSSLVITWFDSLKQKNKMLFAFKEILSAELVGSGRSGIVYITNGDTKLIISIADKATRKLFIEFLFLFIAQ